MKVRIIENKNSYKIGIDEVEGLKDAMKEVLAPVLNRINEDVYWNILELEETEYKRRDGFIPYSHNCGGVEISAIIPKCEEYNFGYLEFGEWDGEHYCDEKDKHDCECPYDSDGEYDAKLRIWLKFEGYDQETGELSFFLYLGGGNGDAPYFRTKYESDIFEASFSCKSVNGLKRASAKHVKALMKVIG